MAEQAVVHIGENSPKRVAYRLMENIASVEGKLFYQERATGADQRSADRQWILDTYADCLRAVRGFRKK